MSRPTGFGAVGPSLIFTFAPTMHLSSVYNYNASVLCLYLQGVKKQPGNPASQPSKAPQHTLLLLFSFHFMNRSPPTAQMPSLLVAWWYSKKSPCHISQADLFWLAELARIDMSLFRGKKKFIPPAVSIVCSDVIVRNGYSGKLRRQ